MLALVGVLALVPAVIFSVIASPSSAEHGGSAGECGFADGDFGAFQDSQRVKAVSPPGTPGLRLAFNQHCNAGNPSDVTQDLTVTADGVVVALLHRRDFFGGGNERITEREIHLPVRAIEEVCLEQDDGDPNTPPQKTCVPPS